MTLFDYSDFQAIGFFVMKSVWDGIFVGMFKEWFGYEERN